GAALVAGIEEAGEFFALVEVGIHFVEQEGGLVLIDEAEEDGGADVFSAERSGHNGGEDNEGGGHAATRYCGRVTLAQAESGVEGFDAELEAFGFGAARAVVFGGGEAGEEGKGR